MNPTIFNATNINAIRERSNNFSNNRSDPTIVFQQQQVFPNPKGNNNVIITAGEDSNNNIINNYNEQQTNIIINNYNNNNEEQTILNNNNCLYKQPINNNARDSFQPNLICKQPKLQPNRQFSTISSISTATTTSSLSLGDSFCSSSILSSESLASVYDYPINNPAETVLLIDCF